MSSLEVRYSSTSLVVNSRRWLARNGGEHAIDYLPTSKNSSAASHRQLPIVVLAIGEFSSLSIIVRDFD